MNTLSKSICRTFSNYEIRDVPICYREVLSRIESLLGSKVLIHSYDAEWLNFSVMNWHDRFAITTLERRVAEVLPGCDLYAFQILCPWDSCDMSGLLLHYMRDPTTRQAYRCGCWFS